MDHTSSHHLQYGRIDQKARQLDSNLEIMVYTLVAIDTFTGDSRSVCGE